MITVKASSQGLCILAQGLVSTSGPSVPPKMLPPSSMEAQSAGTLESNRLSAPELTA